MDQRSRDTKTGEVLGCYGFLVLWYCGIVSVANKLADTLDADGRYVLCFSSALAYSLAFIFSFEIAIEIAIEILLALWCFGFMVLWNREWPINCRYFRYTQSL